MRALILVDIQNDFCPGGALAVRDGDYIISKCNELQGKHDLVVATQDWHPVHHESFASSHPGRRIGEVIQLHGLRQVLWPDHCVAESQGAQFHRLLEKERIARVFRKGMDPKVDSYSGFFDNGRKRSTGLSEYLREVGVSRVTVVGLATDYCVKYTALDAQSLGFFTQVMPSATKGVELQKGDVAKAFEEMKAAGIEVSDETH